MNSLSFVEQRLPPAYRQWNHLLAQELFPRGRAGVRVYLAVHDGLLNDCGARAGCGGRDEFVRAVLGLTSYAPRLFTSIDRHAEFWSENGQGGEPPIIAGLAFAVLAASEMATDEKATQANYYYRLSSLMGIENEGRPESFECTPALWRMLRAWLRMERRGELIVHGLDSQHPFVGPVQSQCLVRSCDLEELAPVVRAAKRRPGQFLEPDDLIPVLRAWFLRGGASSRLARLLGRDPDEASLSQAAEALCDAMEGLTVATPSAESMRAPAVERATLALRPSPYPNLVWKRARWLLRIPAGNDAEEHECLALVGERAVIGKLDVREPPCYDIEIAGEEAARILRGDAKVADENGNDVTPSQASLAWFQDGAVKGRPGSWPLVPAPAAGMDHTIVALTAERLAGVSAALERPATAVESDHWPGPGLHAACGGVPLAGAILPGNIAVSSRPRLLGLIGGLRIRRGTYLRGGLPKPESLEGAAVRIERVDDAEFSATVPAAELPTLDLSEGRYVLHCDGSTADIFVLEPRWRECSAAAAAPGLDRAVSRALLGTDLRGGVLEVRDRRHASYFRPGVRYRVYSPNVMKGAAPADAGIHEFLSPHPIRYATLMGQSGQVARPLPSAPCFGETTGGEAALEPGPFNRLLEYVSARSAGSVELVRSFCAEIAGDGAWHRPLSVLEELGHIDIAWENARAWTVAPPSAHPRADGSGLAILVGARARGSLDWLKRHGIEARIDARGSEPARGFMPDCIVATAESLQRAAGALADIGLRLYEDSPSQQLAQQTRRIVEREWWTGPGFTPPLAKIQRTLQRWDRLALCWFDTADLGAQGLYRWRDSGRRMHYLVTGDGGFQVTDPAAAKWFVAGTDAAYLQYEPAARRLRIPVAMDLPRIWKRICALASGLAPLRAGRVLIYEDVPLNLARAAAVRLNQPRTEGIQ